MQNKNNFEKKEDSGVDIILPNYNKGYFLQETLNSIFSQTYKNWNLILIDDNSQDDSKNIIEHHKSYNKNINVIYLKFRKLLFEFFLYISKLPLNLEGKVRSR